MMTVTLDKQREELRALLNEYDAADALASYYALHHDPARTELFTYRDGEGRLMGFLARAQTGFDLFRPVVTLRMRGPDVPESLVREGLLPGRPYLVIAPDVLAVKLKPYVALTDVTRNFVLRLDPSRFEPIINVLVEEKQDEQGNPRCEIRRGDDVLALAGVNWRSPVFAEIYVNVAENARGRGFGKAVVSTCSAALLAMGVTPLYVASADNAASLRLADRVGFVDTGAREVVAHGVLREPQRDEED